MMQQFIADKRKRIVFLFVVCLCLVFGCTKKQEVTKEPKINPEDYLKVSFTEIVDNYFFNDDIDGLQQCIGKIVLYEEMLKLREKYGTSSYCNIIFMSLKDASIPKTLMYIRTQIPRKEGNRDSRIIDIAYMNGMSGNSIGAFELRKDNPDGDFFIRVENGVGLVEYKAQTGKFPIPLGKKVIPDWIVSVNGEGKINIAKPIDKSIFIYIPDEPV